MICFLVVLGPTSFSSYYFFPSSRHWVSRVCDTRVGPNYEEHTELTNCWRSNLVGLTQMLSWVPWRCKSKSGMHVLRYTCKFVKPINVSLFYKPLLEAGPELGKCAGNLGLPELTTCFSHKREFFFFCTCTHLSIKILILFEWIYLGESQNLVYEDPP